MRLGINHVFIIVFGCLFFLPDGVRRIAGSTISVAILCSLASFLYVVEYHPDTALNLEYDWDRQSWIRKTWFTLAFIGLGVAIWLAIRGFLYWMPNHYADDDGYGPRDAIAGPLAFYGTAWLGGIIGKYAKMRATEIRRKEAA
jgi:hypothetical protein